jgi:uncharacterized protein (DUF3820 family)
MKYKINNLEFINKGQITEHCRDIMNRNSNKILSGSDLEFILEILSYHSNKTKLNEFKFIKVDEDKYHKNLCLWIYKETKTGKEVVTDISWTKCIGNIPFSPEKIVDYNFKFGKYKGKSIYDINDNQYIEWVLENLTELKRGDKILLNQYLKYGYIPYNPMFYKNK